MSKYTITPWRSHADLLHVRDQIYGQNPQTQNFSTSSLDEARRKATHRIFAWKLRSPVPHAIESTALLVDALLHHHAATQNASSNISAFSIRAVYAAAITRFVTGFCDIGRSRERSLDPSSMLEIARQIGLPGHFVGLRHEATHEEIPGLKRLVGAAEEALGWLWGVYWSKLGEAEAKEGVGGEEVEAWREEVRVVLRGFRKERRDALRRGEGMVLQDAGVRRVGDQLVGLCGKSKVNVSALCEVLVEDQLLLPASRELGSPLTGAFLIWDSLLHHLFQHVPHSRRALMDALLRALIDTTMTGSANDSLKEGHCQWLAHILLSKTFARPDATEEQRVRAHAMKTICLYPGHWTEVVGRQLLQDDDGGMAEDWRELFEASIIHPAQNSSSELGVQEKDSAAPRATPEGSDLKVRTDEEHSTVPNGGWTKAVVPFRMPIGVVPG